MTCIRALTAVGMVCALSSVAAAQANRPRDPLQLSALQQAAVTLDPRFEQLRLQASAAALRIRNIEAERRPSVTAEGQVQYQSDVPTAPILLPNGQPIFSPPKNSYDAFLKIEQRVVDPTLSPRLSAERAQLAETQARVQSTLFALRQDVNDAFFAAALLQERIGTLTATIAGLDARLREMRIRVTEGAALPAEAATVEATLLQRQQDQAEVRAGQKAALARLTRLTGRSFADTDDLSLPDLADAVARARQDVDAIRARPEYQQFARTRERLARQQDVIRADQQPRVSAFARLGYGRPGLNFISSDFESYGVIGVQVQWKPLTWGTPNREREELATEQEIVAADQAAFSKTIGRATENDVATIDRLEAALALDNRIVTLREEIEQSARVRLDEGVVTATDYIDRNTELLNARLARSGHLVELAQTSARLLTTLGLEVR